MYIYTRQYVAWGITSVYKYKLVHHVFSSHAISAKHTSPGGQEKIPALLTSFLHVLVCTNRKFNTE